MKAVVIDEIRDLGGGLRGPPKKVCNRNSFSLKYFLVLILFFGGWGITECLGRGVNFSLLYDFSCCFAVL